MGFGGFGAPGMGFGAGAQNANFNQAGQPTVPGADGAEPDAPPGEDPPLPPGENGAGFTNNRDNQNASGNGISNGPVNAAKPMQPLMGSTFQPWAAAPGSNIPFSAGIAPSGNAPPGFNSIPSQVMNHGVSSGLSKKALKKKRKKEREEAEAAALQAKTNGQVANPTPHSIPPPPGPPPNPSHCFAPTTTTPSTNAMNVENWPDSLR